MFVESEETRNSKKDKLELDELKVPVTFSLHREMELVNKNNLVSAVQDFQTRETKTKNIEVTNTLCFNDLLMQAGEFGLYQFILFFACAPFFVYGVFVEFSQLFITQVSSQHWCWIPELANLSAVERRDIAIPLDKNERYEYSQCTSYSTNWSQILISDLKATSHPIWEIVPCQNGWEFNKSEIPYETISSELGWVCDKSSYQATAQSIFFLGSAFGGCLMGWLADKYGRIPAITVSNVIGCIGGIISIFARDFREFAFCRFFTGISYDSCMMLSFLLVLEYIAPKYRTLFANLAWATFYSMAAVSLPWIALACGYWKTILVATSLPLSLAVLNPLILPESTQWLLSNGRVDDAIAKVLTISKVNKKVVPSKAIQDFKKTVLLRESETTSNVLEILKNPFIRKVFILMCIEFMCCSILFDVLVRSLGRLKFNFFVSFSLVSFTEFPSIFMVAFCMDWLGRRWMIVVTSTLACTFSVLTVFIGSGLPSVLCTMIARFCINMMYNTTYQWEAEVLPTSVRASGIAIIHICGNIAAMLSPYIAYLEIYKTWLPPVLTGSIAALAGIIAISLPETANKVMPQNFQEAEEIARSHTFLEKPCFMNNKKEVNGAENPTFQP